MKKHIICERSDIVQGDRVFVAVAFEDQEKFKEALLDLGGRGNKRARVVSNVLDHLRKIRPSFWCSPKAAGRIERFLSLRQKPNQAEIEDVRQAYARFVPELIEANCAKNSELAETLTEFMAMALASDPERSGPRVAAARELVRALQHLVRVERR